MTPIRACFAEEKLKAPGSEGWLEVGKGKEGTALRPRRRVTGDNLNL